MARKSMVELQTALASLFPDNNTGMIDPLDLRTFLNDHIEAIRPAYGALQRATPNAQSLTTTPAIVIFETGVVSDVPDYSVNAAGGTITRVERGSCNIIFNGTVSGPNGTVVRMELYKDGIATTWVTAATCSGASEPIAITLNAFQYNAAAAIYTLRASVVGTAQSITFDDLDWLIETIPVNTY